MIAGQQGTLSAPMRRLVLVWPQLDFGSLMPGVVANDVIRQEAAQLGLDPAEKRPGISEAIRRAAM